MVMTGLASASAAGSGLGGSRRSQRPADTCSFGRRIRSYLSHKTAGKADLASSACPAWPALTVGGYAVERPPWASSHREHVTTRKFCLCR